MHASWAAPTNCPVNDYVVTHELTTLDQCRQISSQPSSKSTLATSITIDGLEPFSTYKVEVAGRVDSVIGEPEFGNGTTGETGE